MKNSTYLILIACTYLHSFEYTSRFPNYNSQHGQDKYLVEEVFKGKQGGFFVEIGAHDGVSYSNTYYFEKQAGWNGICVEPISEIFERLKINRQCACENVCIDVIEGKQKFLRCYGYITEMYSGIENYYDLRHLQRIEEEILRFGGNKSIIEVDCITMNQLLEKYAVNKIDLLSLDIEGGEEKILRSIDYDRVKIGVILVENNFFEESIRLFLSSKGYVFIKRIGKDDIFIAKEFFE